MPEYRLFLYLTKEFSMKIGRLFFVLFAVAAVLGCVTEKIVEVEKERIRTVREEAPPKEEPLTPGNLERLQKMQEFTQLKDYQFILSGQIILNLVKPERDDHNNKSVAGAIFRNVLVRNSITFKDKTFGQAIGDVTVVGDEYRLRVYFESPQDETKYPAETHFLTFHARRAEPTAYFYLLHDAPKSDIDEKGTLKYGSDTYTLIFNDEDRPYLLHRLERVTAPGGEPREVGGRKVN